MGQVWNFVTTIIGLQRVKEYGMRFQLLHQLELLFEFLSERLIDWCK